MPFATGRRRSSSPRSDATAMSGSRWKTRGKATRTSCGPARSSVSLAGARGWFERFAGGGEAAGGGLGLAIARAYARAHGGDLVYEPLGMGARFELIVPQDTFSRSS